MSGRYRTASRLGIQPDTMIAHSACARRHSGCKLRLNWNKAMVGEDLLKTDTPAQGLGAGVLERYCIVAILYRQ